MAAGRSLSRSERKAAARAEFLRQEEQRERRRQVSRILRKPAADRSADEAMLLSGCQEMVRDLERLRKKRERLRRRLEEVCDEPDELKRKVSKLSAVVRGAKHLIVYTGAGISTAASIPDYRGPNGVWTMLQKGRSIRATDLSEAEPTLTHMSIACLHNNKLVKHVVSQNCDGLHLRSGLPREALSELHGNMYIEVCTSCTPNREYVRIFDVTERTALHRHQTGRLCHKCGVQLRDTIVHFGEKGILQQPLNWEAATEAAGKADVILCLGSSLKVLKKYPHLWCMSKPPRHRPKLYIVNLQWTPKDDLAVLKLHGRCDDVMKLLMDELGLPIPSYDRMKDPIFSLAVPLQPAEESSHSRKPVAPPASLHEVQLGEEQQMHPDPPSGGWFGRGCAKGTKRKKNS
ncbi:NAD-dependent protein deacetylase sirtuin-7 isoform X2 [Ahaetulla prasina]|uniref:NAD-dependent protein deacetylase sirtuin-7 isoform X2 n=1 Tax=Ahaetulla prasina TaxID=499056 RepID=UPI002648B05C|nr:NAD-dependent protein deacetylase sirtuin-7 isoform X2 [Ahaetulla prasina]